MNKNTNSNGSAQISSTVATQGSQIVGKTLPPTWRGVLPLIISTIIEGSDNSRKIAIEELYRLADFADMRREG